MPHRGRARRVLSGDRLITRLSASHRSRHVRGVEVLAVDLNTGLLVAPGRRNDECLPARAGRRGADRNADHEHVALAGNGDPELERDHLLRHASRHSLEGRALAGRERSRVGPRRASHAGRPRCRCGPHGDPAANGRRGAGPGGRSIDAGQQPPHWDTRAASRRVTFGASACAHATPSAISARSSRPSMIVPARTRSPGLDPGPAGDPRSF